MGSRRGIGHTERMGSASRDARKGVTNADRSDRPSREEGAELDENGVMTEAEIARRTVCSAETKTAELGSGDNKIRVKYAFWTQRGYYPDDLNKANQDSFSITHNFAGVKQDSLFAIYDGHGRDGHDCADFAKRNLPTIQARYLRQARIKKHKENLAKESGGAKQKGAFNPRLWPMLGKNEYESACRKSLLETNKAMRKDDCDDTLSGTTVISASFHDGRVVICNVGDSRAILGSKFNKESILAGASEEEKVEEKDEGVLAMKRQEVLKHISNVDATEGELLAIPLSQDQTPWRPDERARVRSCGARVMTVDQMEGIEPIHDNWGMVAGEDIDTIGDPPRVWRPDEDFPGTAFTRSLGDFVAEELGVTAEPEIVTKEITSNDEILVIASDGVFEFITNQRVIDICSDSSDPLEACQRVVKEAYMQWLHFEDRTDDITVIVLFMESEKSGGSEEMRATAELLSSAIKQGQTPMKSREEQEWIKGGRSNSMHGNNNEDALLAARVTAGVEDNGKKL